MIKRFWKPLTAILIFIISQITAGLLMGLIHLLGISLTTAMACSIIVSGTIAIAVCYVLHIIRPKTFSINNIKWRHIPLALAAALMGIFSMGLLMEQIGLPDLMKGEMRAMAYNIWGIIAIALIGPITEELIFREAIIGSLLRHRVHRWQAILISATLFGLIHINPAQVPFAIAMGVILGIIYTKMGNIVLTSIIHIFNNTLAVIEIRLLGEHFDEFSYCEVLGGKLMTWGYLVTSAMLCIIFLSQFWEKYHRSH